MPSCISQTQPFLINSRYFTYILIFLKMDSFNHVYSFGGFLPPLLWCNCISEYSLNIHYVAVFCLANSLWLLWDGSYVSFLCSSRSCCNRLSLHTVFSKAGRWPHVRSLEAFHVLFYSQRKEQFSNKANVLSRRGVVFPAKFPAYYTWEGSSRTFALRINTQPQQCIHGTPKLAYVQLFFYSVKT